MRRLAAGFALLIAISSTAARAAQWGEVTSEEVTVHDLPNGTSPIVGRAARRTRVQLSDRMVRDVFGEYWYKARLEDGQVGYLPAKAVRTDRLINEQRDAGLQEREIPEADLDLDPQWTFVARGMLAGGTAAAETSSFGAGGEAELTATPFYKAVGYERRRFSAGMFFQLLGGASVFGASVVYRHFVPHRLEPEFRLRLGSLGADGASAFGTGLCGGVRYPFTTRGGPHLALYAEGQGFFAFDASLPVLVSLGLGIGYHF